MRTLRSLLAVLVLGTAGGAGAQALPEPKSYLTGNEYLKMSEEQRQAYVMGLVDGIGLGRWSVLALPGKMETVYRRVAECTEPWSVHDTMTVIDRYLDEHTQFRETLVPMVADLAISTACHLGRR
jgi:hypothetical protein